MEKAPGAPPLPPASTSSSPAKGKALPRASPIRVNAAATAAHSIVGSAPEHIKNAVASVLGLSAPLAACSVGVAGKTKKKKKNRKKKKKNQNENGEHVRQISAQQSSSTSKIRGVSAPSHLPLTRKRRKFRRRRMPKTTNPTRTVHRRRSTAPLKTIQMMTTRGERDTGLGAITRFALVSSTTAARGQSKKSWAGGTLVPSG